MEIEVETTKLSNEVLNQILQQETERMDAWLEGHGVTKENGHLYHLETSPLTLIGKAPRLETKRYYSLWKKIMPSEIYEYEKNYELTTDEEGLLWALLGTYTETLGESVFNFMKEKDESNENK